VTVEVFPLVAVNAELGSFEQLGRVHVSKNELKKKRMNRNANWVEMPELYTDQSFNKVPSNAPHAEISNRMLRKLYICNIVLCLVTLAVGVNEIVINRDCVVCSDTSREAAYWLAVVGIVAAGLCLVLNIFALATRSGFRRK
jgi:hypothetical protein